MTALVLIHGYLESPEMWDLVMPTTDLPTMRLSQPGHSPHALPGVATMDQLALEAWKAIDAAGFDRVHFIGHSMGGYLALACAADQPDRVLSVCLFHSTAREDAPEKKERREKAIQSIGQDPIVYLRAMIGGLYARPELSAAAIEAQIARNNRLRPSDLQTCLRIMKSRHDSIEFLNKRTFKFGYVAGSGDPLIHPDGLHQEAAEANADFIRFVNYAGHMSHLENPSEAKEHLSDWLRLTVQ